MAGDWLKEVLGLPGSASVGFVTGGQGANTAALVAARHHVLAEAGWDVGGDGLTGASPVRVVAAPSTTPLSAARCLPGLGSAVIQEVPARTDGTIDVETLEQVLAGGPDAPPSSASTLGM